MNIQDVFDLLHDTAALIPPAPSHDEHLPPRIHILAIFLTIGIFASRLNKKNLRLVAATVLAEARPPPVYLMAAAPPLR